MRRAVDADSRAGLFYMRAACIGLALLALLGTQPSAQTLQSAPLPAPDAGERALFESGSKEFGQRWVVAPSAFGSWGRGPTSNAESCTDCHSDRGRGHPPETPAQPLRAGLLRLSIPGRGAHGEPLPHPVYGDQLQFQGVLGKVPGEGEVYVHWHTHTVAYTDGKVATLRRPVVELHDLQFGPLGRETMLSLRVAPPLWGLGLLEALSEETILATVERQAELGLTGRANVVWSYSAQRTMLGRFGWKANQPTLRQQIASAFLNDLGVTSALFPAENCPQPQTACRAFPRTSTPELKPEQLDALESYVRMLAAPARRSADDPRVRRGEHVFTAIGCGSCHLPALAGSDNMIHPYTDLLLHDMGQGLADGRPDFAAGPRDWRTAPLWGVGQQDGPYLHDGRARTLGEAILWHGGEAHPARERFRSMGGAERAALLAFLKSL
jgi:CxxC motif-containing protein (DUF1111 family)